MIGMASVFLKALPWTQDAKGTRTRTLPRVSGASRDPSVVRTLPSLCPIDGLFSHTDERVSHITLPFVIQILKTTKQRMPSHNFPTGSFLGG